MAVDWTGDPYGPFYVAENKAIAPIRAKNFAQTSAVRPHLVVRRHMQFEGITLGIEQFRDPKELRLHRMLTQPFRNDKNTSTRLH